MGSDSSERLSRFLAGAGVSSRRHADELIAQGRVTVNGEVARLGQKVVPGVDEIAVDGSPVFFKEKPVYMMVNKPPGYLSTCDDPFDRKTVLSLVPGILTRVYPVGRLDLDADGLIVLTNDGDLTNLLTHPKHHVVKEYEVAVFGNDVEAKTKRIGSDIIVDSKRVEVDYVRLKPQGQGASPKVVIAVHEGEKHLVKNIMRAVGLKVRRLTRTKMGPLSLGDLPMGKWRRLSDREVALLYADACRVWEGERNGER